MNDGNRGEHNPQAKLTEGQVHDIRAMLDAGHTQHAIAECFGVSQALICKINTGEKWGWLPHLPPTHPVPTT